MNNGVMLIDDDDDLREVMTFALTESGFVVRPYADATRALKDLRESPVAGLPFLILVDYFMPKMDGLKFIREARLSVGDKVPMILCSAAGEVETAELEGVLHFPKPIELEDLLALVRHHKR